MNDISEPDYENLDKSKYFKQLRIFAQLRLGLEQDFLKIMDSISTFFKEENDPLYKRGEQKGELRGQLVGEQRGKRNKAHTVISNLLSELTLTDQQIARIADVPVSFVRKVRKEVSIA